MKMYDLKSDTVTLPSREMRKLMAKADVGDDVYGEDATINKLEELAAKITGKREALFIPSGSMGNLIPLYINGGRGNEVLSQMNSHIFHYELASATSVAGVMPVAVKGERGILRPEELEKHLRPASYLMPRITMIEIENTHNREGGTCYTHDQLKLVSDFARKHSFSLHMDGARMFNASVATRLPVRRMCSLVDTVTFCLSKGLGAPVGSVLCGSSKFIAEARRIRKMLGGGMRQAGIIAAAGMYALEHNIERLKDDHANAKRIAESLSALDWANVDMKNVETNIIYFNTPAHPADQIAAQLKKRGVLCSAFADRAIRMVTHMGITGQDVDEICRLLREVKV